MSQRYLRSVNIAHDLSEAGSELTGYVATPLVLQTLARIVRGLSVAAQGRAYSIIGPYGTGKSAFGVFLAHWLGSNSQHRKNLITKHAPTLVTEIDNGVGVLFPIPLTSRCTTLRQSIISSTLQRIATIGSKKSASLQSALEQASGDHDVSPEVVAELLVAANEFIKRHTHYAGIVLLVDELGQHLSQIHRSGDARDLFVLQTIAEAASRTQDNPLLVITILHQTFERYSTTASVAQQTEWAKVQGRYIDLVFQEPFAQMMRFAANVLAGYSKPKEWNSIASKLALEANTLGLKPNELDDASWASLVFDSYPLHPTVLVALPYLFRSIAQNERSLFAFLTANERGALQEHGIDSSSVNLYRTHDLYSYVENTLGPGLFGRAKGRPWVEVSELLNRSKDFPLSQLHVLSTIGTLSAINEDRILKPRKELICFALSDDGASATVSSDIQKLLDKQVVLFSSFRDRLRLSEASDINIDEKLQIHRNDLSIQQDMVALLQEYVQLRPVTAYQHSYVTGTLRSFLPQFVDAQAALRTKAARQHDGDADLLYVVILDDEVREKVLRSPRTDAVLVLPERTTQLRDALLDVAAHRILSSDTEINHDRVAKRELALRLAEAESTLSELIRTSYGNVTGTWLVSGKVHDVRDARKLDEALSRFLDNRFSSAPHIRNELIVRKKLSSTISRARRMLIEKLLEQSTQRLFDGEAFPPERAIYESIFIAGKIHVEREDGTWQLASPSLGNDPLRLKPTFDAIESFFASTEDQRRPLTDLYDLLVDEPFGIREPIIPLLFVCQYLINTGEVALYEHDSFVAVPDIATFERLLAKPSYFAIRRTPTSKLRAALFERVAKAFAPQALQKSGTVAVLDAVKPMLKFAQQLPAYVKGTANLSSTTRSVLDVLLTAKAPDDLLYRQLPQALNMQAVSLSEELADEYVNEFAAKLRTTLEELQNAYTILYKRCINEFAEAVVSQSSDPALLYNEMLERMHVVLTESADVQLRALAIRIKAAEPSKWMEPVAALLGKKPLASWTDADIGVFQLGVSDVGRRLRLLEQVTSVTNTKYLGASRRRVGLTDNTGERSIVVQIPDSSRMNELRSDINQLLASKGLDVAERLGLLAALLDDVLPRDIEG